MKNIAIFASGSGTNAEAIAKYFKDRGDIKVAVCLCNRRDAGVYERMEKLDVPCHYFPKVAWTTGEDVLRLLTDLRIDFIALAGFLAMVPHVILNAYKNAIVNIHPSLLPKHGGPGMYGMRVHQAVLNNGEEVSGITIHYVDEIVDGGKIIFQAQCPVLKEDVAETLAQRVHELEHKYFPIVIEDLLI